MVTVVPPRYRSAFKCAREATSCWYPLLLLLETNFASDFTGASARTIYTVLRTRDRESSYIANLAEERCVVDIVD